MFTSYQPAPIDTSRGIDVKSDPKRAGSWQVAQEMLTGSPFFSVRELGAGRPKLSTQVATPDSRVSKYSRCPRSAAAGSSAYLFDGSAGGGRSGKPARLATRVHSSFVHKH